MEKHCRHCGRNTDAAPEPVEWKGQTYCSEACWLNDQQSRGLSAKGTRKPPSLKGLLQRIADLPSPLKVVVWLNIILTAINLISAVAASSSVSAETNIQSGFDIALSVLIIVGIIQASRLIRIIVLALSWIAVIMSALGLVFGLFHLGLQAIALLLPFGISAITIWGLSTNRSKAYFGY